MNLMEIWYEIRWQGDSHVALDMRDMNLLLSRRGNVCKQFFFNTYEVTHMSTR